MWKRSLLIGSLFVSMALPSAALSYVIAPTHGAVMEEVVSIFQRVKALRKWHTSDPRGYYESWRVNVGNDIVLTLDIRDEKEYDLRKDIQVHVGQDSLRLSELTEAGLGRLLVRARAKLPEIEAEEKKESEERFFAAWEKSAEVETRRQAIERALEGN